MSWSVDFANEPEVCCAPERSPFLSRASQLSTRKAAATIIQVQERKWGALQNNLPISEHNEIGNALDIRALRAIKDNCLLEALVGHPEMC